MSTELERTPWWWRKGEVPQPAAWTVSDALVALRALTPTPPHYNIEPRK